MSYFRYLCFFAYSGVQDILCCVPYMASISGLSICIASSVFSNIYLKKNINQIKAANAIGEGNMSK